MAASPTEVDELLKWLALDRGVDDFLWDDNWQLEVLTWVEQRRTRAWSYARAAGISVSEPKSRNAPPGRKPRQEMHQSADLATVGGKTRDKSDVVAKYVAHRAAQRRDVAEFKRDVLDRRLRSSKETSSVLLSANYLSSRDKWESLITDLMQAYGWNRDATVNFLVSGTAPTLLPIQTRLVGLGAASDSPVALEFTVMPWTTAEEVKTAFQTYQYQVLGGDNRPLGERALKLFRFVTENESNPESKPSRKELLVRWNAHHRDIPKYGYDNLSQFNRDFTRIEKIAQRCLAENAKLSQST